MFIKIEISYNLKKSILLLLSMNDSFSRCKIIIFFFFIFNKNIKYNK